MHYMSRSTHVPYAGAHDWPWLVISGKAAAVMIIKSRDRSRNLNGGRTHAPPTQIDLVAKFPPCACIYVYICPSAHFHDRSPCVRIRIPFRFNANLKACIKSRYLAINIATAGRILNDHVITRNIPKKIRIHCIPIWV